MTAALEPDPRRARVRIAVGAAVTLVLVGLGAAVLVGALAPAGESAVVEPGGGSGRPEASSSGSSGSAARPSGSAARPSGSADESSDGSAVAAVYVHVVGQVANPGLYRLSDGARVVDAVAAAGGLTPAADAAAVNLARPVTDGEQLVVTAVGEAPPAGSSAGTGSSAGAGGSSSGGSGMSAGVVNLNTADAAALETLPRIGPSLARRILDWRSANGRFSSVEDLRAVSGIGEKTFEGLKDRVRV